MSEVTAATPIREPLTLEEVTAGLSVLVDRQNELVAAGNREMEAFRRTVEAARLVPGRVMTDLALYHAVGAVRDRQQEAREHAEMIAEAADLIRDAATIKMMAEMRRERQAAELAAAPKSLPHPHRKPRTSRQPGTRSLRSLGAAVPAGAGLRAAFGGVRLPFLVGHKAALTAVAGGALTAAAIGAMPASHTLQDITGIGTWHAPAAIIWRAEPVVRLPSSLPTDAYIQPEKHPKPVVTLASAPVPVPVVAVPQVTPSQPDPSSDSSQTDQSSQSPDSSQPDQTDQTSDPSQPSQWQAQGRHAGPDSPPGDSGYQPRHDGGSQDSSQQDGSGHGTGWQNDSQQGGQQQNGNWQSGGQQGGGQQGGHGQRGGR